MACERKALRSVFWRQAPLEQRVVLLDKRLEILRTMMETKNEGWAMSQHMAELRHKMKKVACVGVECGKEGVQIGEGSEDWRIEAAEELLQLRTNIESKGFEEIQEVCGAFVTFEHQAAARVAADLFHPDLFRQCFREPPHHSPPHPTERHLLSF
ncbi:MAG: hypothetical protein SGPRY_014281, partial [Prymnesium sp.]